MCCKLLLTRGWETEKEEESPKVSLQEAATITRDGRTKERGWKYWSLAAWGWGPGELRLRPVREETGQMVLRVSELRGRPTCLAARWVTISWFCCLWRWGGKADVTSAGRSRDWQLAGLTLTETESKNRRNRICLFSLLPMTLRGRA